MADSLKRGKFAYKRPCTNPKCVSPNTGRPSKDGMAVYIQDDGTKDATCFSCGYYDKGPFDDASLDNTSDHPSDKIKGEVHSALSLAQLFECPMRSIPSRHISVETAKFYGVRTLLNGLDGQTPVAIAYPYYNIYNNIIGYKKRVLSDKIFTAIGDMKIDNISLFGANKFNGGKKLYITEGEIDALSLYQTLKTLAGPGYKHLDPCVVSLPHGAKSAANALGTPHTQEFLSKFSEIILVFDQDEAGQEAVSSVCSFLPIDKVKIASLTEKDANAMLMAGKSNDLKWAVLTEAKSYHPEGITTSARLVASALAQAEQGTDWPWPTLTELTYGISPGIIGIGAGVGIGKTEFFHELIHHTAIHERRPVGVFLLEEAPGRTLKILAGKSINKALHRPDVIASPSDVEESIKHFFTPREYLYLFDHKGSRDWDTIFAQCKYLAAVHNVRDIVIDPLTAIISHEENTDRALHKLMADMSMLVADPYNCTVYYSSHLNEPPRDRRPHEEGGRVQESHFAGSRAMIRFSNYIIGLERNKQEPELSKRNTTTVRVLKDRDYGTATGETFELYYDIDTGRYLEQTFDF